MRFTFKNTCSYGCSQFSSCLLLAQNDWTPLLSWVILICFQKNEQGGNSTISLVLTSFNNSPCSAGHQLLSKNLYLIFQVLSVKNQFCLVQALVKIFDMVVMGWRTQKLNKRQRKQMLTISYPNFLWCVQYFHQNGQNWK